MHRQSAAAEPPTADRSSAIAIAAFLQPWRTRGLNKSHVVREHTGINRTGEVLEFLLLPQALGHVQQQKKVARRRSHIDVTVRREERGDVAAGEIFIRFADLEPD